MAARDVRSGFTRLHLSLTPDGIERLALLEVATGMSRSAIVDSLLYQFSPAWLICVQTQIEREIQNATSCDVGTGCESPS